MALIDFKVLPGIDKQDTASGAENRWIDCDKTRFRNSLPIVSQNTPDGCATSARSNYLPKNFRSPAWVAADLGI